MQIRLQKPWAVMSIYAMSARLKKQCPKQQILPWMATGCCCHQPVRVLTCFVITVIGVISSVHWWRHCDAAGAGDAKSKPMAGGSAAIVNIGNQCCCLAGDGDCHDFLCIHGYGGRDCGQ